MFITANQIEDISSELLVHFEFNLTSASSLNEIASVVSEHMTDNSLPNRKSLCLVIAKLMKAKWQEVCFQTKKTINNQ